MSEVLGLIVDYSLEMAVLWMLISIFALLIMRNTYWSILDPIVVSLILVIAPGLAGLLCVMLYIETYAGFFYKTLLISISFVIFFYCFWLQFRKVEFHPHEVIISESKSWQFIVLILTVLIALVNLAINGNFESTDPSHRFANVSIPSLNYLAIAVSGYPAVFLSFTRAKSIQILSAISLIAITFVTLQAAASKSFFISFLIIYLYWNFSRNRMEIKEIQHFVKKMSFTLGGLRFIALSTILGMIGVGYLFITGLADISSIFIRFLLSFDSPIIFSASSSINADAPSSATGFHTFLDVWMKPFLKNIIGIQFTFENISQYLTYEMTGYRANTYQETSWQPNNNIIIDFIVLHGWFAIPLSAIAGLLLGKVHALLKAKHTISRNTLPYYILIVINPFYALTDAQSFFTSAILSGAFILSVNIVFSLLKAGSNYKVNENNNAHLI